MRRILPYARGHRHETPAGAAALECVDVSVRYPGAERLAVSGVSLAVKQGGRVALLGSNGAGKSTLLKAAAGLLPVAGGTMRVHGSRVGCGCHRVAYLAQRSDLDWRFPMTVRGLVLTGRYVHLGWFARPGRRDQEIVGRALEALQISDLAERPIGELSGGQQQRALLARALAQEAEVLMLDEPLNAVDAATRAVFGDVLRTLARSGKTIIAATHDTADLDVHFDEVIRLENGRRVERAVSTDAWSAPVPAVSEPV